MKHAQDFPEALSDLLPVMSRGQYRHKGDAHVQILGAVPWYRNPGTPHDAVTTANGHPRHVHCVVISRLVPPLTAATLDLAPKLKERKVTLKSSLGGGR